MIYRNLWDAPKTVRKLMVLNACMRKGKRMKDLKSKHRLQQSATLVSHQRNGSHHKGRSVGKAAQGQGALVSSLHGDVRWCCQGQRVTALPGDTVINGALCGQETEQKQGLVFPTAKDPSQFDSEDRSVSIRHPELKGPETEDPE